MLNSYWEYAGTRYKNKFRAIDASRGNINDISFTYFDNNPSFSDFAWSIEPQTPLNELMKNRAQQLRDKYTYLKLWYSGGHDSTTVLNTFMNNNIHLDEIVVYRFSGNNNFDSDLGDYEINNYTLPYLKNIQNKLPKTKITVYEFGKDHFDKHLGEKWFYTKNNFSVRHFYIPKINGKNYCHIFGGNDPNADYENGEWFLDIWDTDAIELTSFNNIELFYTTPDLPKLHCKQCHILKNILKKNKLFKSTRAEKKKIIRELLRDVPPVILNKSLAKTSHGFFDSPKENETIKSTFTKEQKDKFRYMISNVTISNIPIYRVFKGYRSNRFSLGV